MKILFFFFGLIANALATTNAAKDLQAPQVSITAEGIEAKLPDAAKQALRNWNPEFVLFKFNDYSSSIKDLVKEINPTGAPMAWASDFDRDGRQDIVLLGQDLHTQYAVVLLNQKAKWKVVQLETWSIKKIETTEIPATDVAAKSTEKGIPVYVIPAQGDYAKKLGKKPGIQLEYFLGSVQVFEISKDKAVPLILK